MISIIFSPNRQEYNHLLSIKRGQLSYENRKALYKIRKAFEKAVLDRFTIVVSTNCGTGSSTMLKQYFDLVMIDECTQDVEPASLIALHRGYQHARVSSIIAKPIQIIGYLFSLFLCYLFYNSEIIVLTFFSMYLLATTSNWDQL